MRTTTDATGLPEPPMRLVERDGFLAAEIDPDPGASLTTDDVRRILERTRR